VLPRNPVDLSSIILEVLPPYIKERRRGVDELSNTNHPPALLPRPDNIPQAAMAVFNVRARNLEEQEEKKLIIRESSIHVNVPTPEPRLSRPNMNERENLLMDASEIDDVPSSM
jgi:hypothetical protein